MTELTKNIKSNTMYLSEVKIQMNKKDRIMYTNRNL